MKKIAMWLAVMALGLCLGCAPDPLEQSSGTFKPDLKFKVGQEVNLVIGGWGQVIEVNSCWKTPYLVRVSTNEGPKYWHFREFELEVPQ